MGKYMYRMPVPHVKNTIIEDETYSLNGNDISISFLKKQFNLLDEEFFSIDTEADTITIERRRIETDEEFNRRRTSAINYNKRFEEYHSQK